MQKHLKHSSCTVLISNYILGLILFIFAARAELIRIISHVPVLHGVPQLIAHVLCQLFADVV